MLSNRESFIQWIALSNLRTTWPCMAVSVVLFVNPLTAMSDQDRISPNNIKHTKDKNKEKCQWGDYKLIQYQILQTSITRTLWQTVKRITNEILGVKGLKLILICWIVIYRLDGIISPFNNWTQSGILITESPLKWKECKYLESRLFLDYRIGIKGVNGELHKHRTYKSGEKCHMNFVK